MDKKEIIIGTLEYIEKNIKADISIDFLASRVSYSKVHFSRLFIFVVGTSVYDYIISRKLIHAAKEIINTKNISGCLYDYGFDTQTGFNKAFKRKFGVTPKQFKLENEIIIPPLIIKDLINKKIKGENMEPRIIKKDSIKIAGYTITTRNINGENNRDIPKFWEDYLTDGRMEKLHSEAFLKSHTEYGACLRMNEKKEFKYLIGVEVTDFNLVPKEYETYTINSSLYAVFTTKKASEETFTSKIQETWQFIFTKWLPNSPYRFDVAGIDFEVYDERCCGKDDKVMDIYIPIIEK